MTPRDLLGDRSKVGPDGSGRMFRMVLEEVPWRSYAGSTFTAGPVTYDWVDVETGEGKRGKLAPANRETFRRWLVQFAGHDVDVVVEGCTGWRFIVEECRAAGVTPHLADPAEASVRIHGVKRRAKTDKVDAKGLRDLGVQGRVPESWIPPAQVLEIRTLVRLYHDLMTDRAWLHRIHATLFHQGAVAQTELLRGDRDRLHTAELLSVEGKAAVQAILRIVEALDSRSTGSASSCTGSPPGSRGARSCRRSTGSASSPR